MANSTNKNISFIKSAHQQQGKSNMNFAFFRLIYLNEIKNDKKNIKMNIHYFVLYYSILCSAILLWN